MTFRAAALLLLLFLLSPVQADYRILDWNSSQPDGSEVRVTSCLDRTPHRGVLPVTVHIRNGWPREHTWTLSFQTGYGPSRGDSLVQSTFPLKVPPRSSTQHQILVPLPTQFEAGRNTTLQATLSDGRHTASGYFQPHEHNSWTSLALSQSLGSAQLVEQLGNQIRAHSSEVRSKDPVAILLDPAYLPPDWRALSGLDALILGTADWTLLPPAVRAAVRDWVRLGHHLLLLDPSGTAPADLSPGPAGLGSVELLRGDALHFPTAKVQERLQTLHANRLQALREEFDQDWPLQIRFGTKNFNPVLVLLLLAAFAILVGPVNLFALANAKHRHRLIFTVPLISVTTSLLLIITILFQDGWGGDGRRLGLLQVFAAADERSACLTQEQFSRTGMLAHRHFVQSPGSLLSHVLLRQSRWTFFHTPTDYQGLFQWSGNQWSGDWFRSRSEQGHLLQSAIPTRGRIEVQPSPAGQAPALVSSFDFPLDSFFYLDETGKAWQATGPVSPGRMIPLAPVSSDTVAQFLKDQGAGFSPFLASAVQSFPRMDRCFALVKHPGPLLIPTHPGVRWTDEPLLLVTQPVGRASVSP